MEDLQVPTRAVEVEVLTDSGERLSGSLFVPESRYGTGQPDEVIEVLNDSRLFLPFRPAASRGKPVREIVVNKDHILTVRVGGSRKGRRQPGRAREAEGGVTLWLSDGSRITGQVAVEMPRASSRPIDKLNQDLRFMPLLCEGCTVFVRRTQVVRLV